MARPRAERTDLGKRDRLTVIQEQRLETLAGFARLLSDEVTDVAAQEDDTYFAALVKLAVNDYGVKQAIIAEKLRVSAPAVSRWMNMMSLPAPYARGGILKALEEIITENVEAQRSADKRVLLTGTVSAFSE